MDVPWVLEPTEWELIYPVQPSTPIGIVRRQRDGFRAWCAQEDLGVSESGDAAAEAIWHRFVEQSSVRHEQAAVTHGAYERHVRS